MNYKNQYIWNTLGTLASTALSLMLLVIVSRLTAPYEADLFSISFTLSQQFLVIGLFGIRSYQSTDVLEEHHFEHYFYSRLITVSFMILTLVTYLGVSHFSIEKNVIITFMTLYRVCDAFSDLFQGDFQQKNRSDLSGKILFYRSLFSVLIFFIILITVNSLLIATVVMFLLNFVMIFALDIRYFFQNTSVSLTSKSQFPRFNFAEVKIILVNCFPLFINGFLITYIFNEPRLVIDKLLENGQLIEGMQRDFNILFMPTFVLNILILILRPMFTQLSLYRRNLEMASFFKLVKKVCAGLLIFIVLVLLLGDLIGIPVLSLIFNVSLSRYKLAFLILLLAGAFNLFSALIDNLMVIYRNQKYMIIVNVLTFLVSKLITLPLISKYQLLGASYSFLITMIVFFVLSATLFWVLNREFHKTSD